MLLILFIFFFINKKTTVFLSLGIGELLVRCGLMYVTYKCSKGFGIQLQEWIVEYQSRKPQPRLLQA